MLLCLKDVKFKSHTVKAHLFHSQHAKCLIRSKCSHKRKHEECKALCQKFTLNISKYILKQGEVKSLSKINNSLGG